jgi:hypothetical protein
MRKPSRVYQVFLLAGLLFFITGVRLYFKHDTAGVIIHLALALILFVSALFAGRRN